MKRARETDVELPAAPAGHAMAAWMTPPPCARPPRAGAGHSAARVALFQGGAESISPWKHQAKRCRDRSVPMDALSRLMSAAVTSARMKKHGVAAMFGASMVEHKAPGTAVSCDACAPMPGRQAALAVTKCAHCERAVGECCRRECENCSGVFCSLCSTLNCDAQFDRVFCLSCNYDMAHS